jgi:primosomal protein DnaI
MQSLGEELQRWSKSAGRSSGEFEKQAERVLKDPLTAKLKADHPGLDDRTLRINLNRLYQSIQEASHCQACPGLEKCPNDMQGHFTRLSCAEVNERWQVVDHKVPCSKWIAHEQQMKLRSRITSFYVDETVLKDAYAEQEMMKLDPNRAPAVVQVLNYVNRTLKEGLGNKGLYLMGQFGTGKTYLAGYLLQKLAKEGYSGVIVYMPEFVEDAKALMFEPQKLKETITLMKETDLLVFDDIGAENLSPWVRDHVLGAILNHRMNRKPTFYTSNHGLAELEKHFSFTHKDGEELHKGQRLMDRIRPFVEEVHLRGRNHRG